MTEAVALQAARRKSWALAATMTVLADISTAANAGGKDALADQNTCGKRNREDAVARSPPEVLDHFSIACPAERDDARHIARIAPDKNDVAASTATSVPAPIAMATSAVTSAGASLTPSPTIATRR